ncbi:MAG TPA: hypothetical protein VLC11_07215, partial [Gemmatimonadales bacterium]|nr:hypothetical protein [Gemmatimonadales bacterium]
MRTIARIIGIAAVFALAAAPLTAQSYRVTHTYTLGGEGGWDYLALDTVGNRLFITRGDRAIVVDPASGKALGEVPGIVGAHGVAFSYASGLGFATLGRDSSVVVFDLKSLKVVKRTPA